MQWVSRPSFLGEKDMGKLGGREEEAGGGGGKVAAEGEGPPGGRGGGGWQRGMWGAGGGGGREGDCSSDFEIKRNLIRRIQVGFFFFFI